MNRRWQQILALGSLAVFVGGPIVLAEEQLIVQPQAAIQPQAQDASPSQEVLVYDFEDGIQDWIIPDWAKNSQDDVGKILSTSEEHASHGKAALQLLADFPGGKWTGAYIEVLMPVTDWSQFGSLSVDAFLPTDAPAGLKGRFILTVGENWTWTEMNRAIDLAPGKWTTIKVNLKPGSLDWKFFPTNAFRKDVRKLGFRVESDKRPVYSGPIYLDNIHLSP